MSFRVDKRVEILIGKNALVRLFGIEYVYTNMTIEGENSGTIKLLANWKELTINNPVNKEVQDASNNKLTKDFNICINDRIIISSKVSGIGKYGRYAVGDNYDKLVSWQNDYVGYVREVKVVDGKVEISLAGLDYIFNFIPIKKNNFVTIKNNGKKTRQTNIKKIIDYLERQRDDWRRSNNSSKETDKLYIKNGIRKVFDFILDGWNIDSGSNTNIVYSSSLVNLKFDNYSIADNVSYQTVIENIQTTYNINIKNMICQWYNNNLSVLSNPLYFFVGSDYDYYDIVKSRDFKSDLSNCGGIRAGEDLEYFTEVRRPFELIEILTISDIINIHYDGGLSGIDKWYYVINNKKYGSFSSEDSYDNTGKITKGFYYGTNKYTTTSNMDVIEDSDWNYVGITDIGLRKKFGVYFIEVAKKNRDALIRNANILNVRLIRGRTSLVPTLLTYISVVIRKDNIIFKNLSSINDYIISDYGVDFNAVVGYVIDISVNYDNSGSYYDIKLVLTK